LKPIYQRNIVWGTKQYIKFIESIFYGIVPGPIVLGIDTATNNKTCIDGKQRSTSLIKFFTNQIPYHEVENNKSWIESQEIKDNYSIEEFLRSQIPNYKVLASVYKIFEYKTNTEQNYDPKDFVNTKYLLVRLLETVSYQHLRC
jgi:uncharacterized protein with ParB-like and HNH nuclease domain